jgi:hypothetical protein
MRLVYFSCQMPYPPTHGGQVDDWRRLRAFKQAGADVTLVTWFSQVPGLEPLPAHLATLQSVASHVHTWGIGTSWPERLRRLWGMRKWPASLASRIPTPTQLAQLWATLDAQRPQAVWLDSIHPSVVARLTAQRYQIPLFVRSHNREYAYIRQQVDRASHWRTRLAWAMNLPHMQAAEREALACAHTVFDISVDDLALWRQEGLTHGQWLPPLVEPEMAKRLASPVSAEQHVDIAYMGNLFAPNNVEGVLWFLQTVLPLILNARPDTTVQIAGSKPVDAVVAAVAQCPGVTLTANVPDPTAVLRGARVLINPVFAGSGVNVKSVEMLFGQADIVSSPQGVAGLPPEVQACFKVATTAPEFAQAVLSSLNGPADADARAQARAARLQAQAAFSFERAGQVLAFMAQVAAQGPVQAGAQRPTRR